MSRYVVDTHALAWFLLGDRRLGANAVSAMSDPGARLDIPAIALAEILWLAASGRIQIPGPRILADIGADSRIRVVPLTRDVVELAQTLQAIPEMHDKLIAATTLLILKEGGEAHLLTKDALIIGAGVVPTIW